MYSPSTIKLCLRLFSFVGTNPKRGFTKLQVLLFSLPILSAFYLNFLAAMRYYSEPEHRTLLEMSDIVSCILLMTHSCFKSVPIFAAKKEIRSLLYKMEIHFWDENQLWTVYQKKIYHDKHRELMKKCQLYVYLYMMTLMSFFLIPLLSEGQALSFELYRPKFIPYYYQLLLNNMCGVLNTLFTILPADMLFLCSITLTEIQFELLGNQMSDLFYQGGAKNFEGRQKLNKCVKHHGFLLRYTKQIAQTYSKMLMMYFGLILVNMCIEMYKTSLSIDTKTIFQSVMYISSAMYEFTFCYCYPVQKLIDQAYRLGDLIYLSNWETTEYINKDVVLMIALSQKGIHIVAGGMTDINSATGLNTVKAMVSYTTFLKTITATD